MKARELEAVLRVLEKHPRVVSLTCGDLTVQLAEVPPAIPAGESEDGDMALPDGVLDPRAAIKALYKRAGLHRDGKVPS